MKTKIIAIIVFALFLCGTFQVAYATQVRRLTFAGLVKKADIIVSGRVINIECKVRKVKGESIPFTFVTIEPMDVLKGSVGGKFYTFKLAGGLLPGKNRYYDYGEMPRFKTGQEVLLFLRDDSSLLSPVVGFFQGRFNLVINEKTGSKMVFNHEGRPVTEGYLFGKNAKSPDSGVNYEVFKAEIKERLKVK